jgi:8-oxo-dGTP pyrophosphatase MutT (NUDIX family)
MTESITPENRKFPVRPRDASSVVVLRGARDNPEVLLGRRRHNARFMPGIYVFPGGRVDRNDAAQAAPWDLRDDVLAKLSRHCTPRRARALVWAAIRETWEESGLLIAAPGRISDAGLSPLHAAYSAANLAPHTGGLDYIFRAITPASSPIRFNTRFFLADAKSTQGQLRRTGELEDIGWWPVSQALRDLDLRGVTRMALHEATTLWRDNPPRDPLRRVKRLTNRKNLTLITFE